MFPIRTGVSVQTDAPYSDAFPHPIAHAPWRRGFGTRVQRTSESDLAKLMKWRLYLLGDNMSTLCSKHCLAKARLFLHDGSVPIA